METCKVKNVKMMFTTFISIFVGLQLAAATASEPVCCSQPGYTHIPETGMCIKLHTAMMSWSEANATCAKENAALVVIRNQADFDAVYTYSWCGVSNLKYPPCYQLKIIWIGGHDMDTEGKFQWANGDAFTDWQKEQITDDKISCDGTPDPDCVIFSLTQKKWHDRNCAIKHQFVCQL